MVNAGLGEANLNKFLAGLSIPPLHPRTLRDREQEVSPFIHATAADSCHRARQEEIQKCHLPG